MREDQFEHLVREAAREYHRPAETPRREIWQRLERERFIRRTARSRPKRFDLWVRVAGLAALLVIGIGIGRLSVKPPEPEAPEEPVVAIGAPLTNAAAYRVAMSEHLAQAEVFLTLFRMSVRHGAVDPSAPGAARPLLATNRLLLDSPVSADPQARKLLEDLELVLAQIAQLSPQPMADEAKSISAGIDQAKLMNRLWTKKPAEGTGT